MKLGISFLMNFKEITTIPEFLKFAYTKDLSAVELVAEPPFCFIDDINYTLKSKIKKEAKNYGLDLTVHAPFFDLNIAAFNQNVRNMVLKILMKCIKFSHEINSKMVTIHPGELGAGALSFQNIVSQNHFNSLQVLSQYAEKYKISLGYENMSILAKGQLEESYSPIPIRKLIDKLNSKNLGITWDIGHSNTTNIKLPEFFEQFKDKLIHLHLHDNIGTNEGWRDTHSELGKGSINWENTLSMIKSINYKGYFILELDNIQKINNSIDFLSTF